MKKYKNFPVAAIMVVSITTLMLASSARSTQEPGYILENEKDISKEQPGPHSGGGSTTAFNFFSKATESKMVFRKRILQPGSSIGYHLQKEEEIYYIVNGNGEMKMNGATFTVQAGDGILTKAGSSHSLRPLGNESLTLIITYLAK